MLYHSIFFLLLTAVNALTLQGSLSRSALPLSRSDITQTALKLSHKGKRTTGYLSNNGHFSFPDVSPGVYRLELQSVPFVADSSYRVDVDTDGEIKVHKVFAGHDFESDLGPLVELPLSIDVKRPAYVVPREEFSVLQMLKNPMMLMSIASLGMVFVLPKLTENMDPEALKELQDSQRQSNAAVDKVQNFDMAEYIAGKTSKAK